MRSRDDHPSLPTGMRNSGATWAAPAGPKAGAQRISFTSLGPSPSCPLPCSAAYLAHIPPPQLLPVCERACVFASLTPCHSFRMRRDITRASHSFLSTQDSPQSAAPARINFDGTRESTNTAKSWSEMPPNRSAGRVRALEWRFGTMTRYPFAANATAVCCHSWVTAGTLLTPWIASTVGSSESYGPKTSASTGPSGVSSRT